MALGRGIHWPTVWMSTLAGLVWGLVIFSIDRFIVSTFRKSESTVNFHINSAKRKLGVYSKPHAVAKMYSFQDRELF